jgi:hypothetical protein
MAVDIVSALAKFPDVELRQRVLGAFGELQRKMGAHVQAISDRDRIIVRQNSMIRAREDRILQMSGDIENLQENLKVACGSMKLAAVKEEIERLHAVIIGIAGALEQLAQAYPVPMTAVVLPAAETIPESAPLPVPKEVITCRVSWCPDKATEKGCCAKHAYRQRTHGDPTYIMRGAYGGSPGRTGNVLCQEISPGVYAPLGAGVEVRGE